MICPCKDCSSREIGCHSKCKKYLEYRKERDLIIETRNKARLDTDYYIDSVRRTKHK